MGSPPDLAAIAARFAELLHAAGIDTGADRTGRFVAGIDVARPATTDELYWIGRVTLTGTPAEIAVYDRVFTQVFRGMIDLANRRGDANLPSLEAFDPGRRRPPPRTGVGDHRGDGSRPSTPGRRNATVVADDAGREVPIAAPTSAEERLRHRDFADCTPDELADLRRLTDQLAVVAPERPSRRRRRHRSGDALDRRATLRRAHRTGGHPAHLVMRRTTVRRRRVVLLADVSGSMEAYSRAYLYLLHGAVRALDAEAFVFATRLTRVTRALRTSDPERALRDAVYQAGDWSGGTRIGAAIGEFNDRWGRRGVARGAVVVIVSDGWESGDPGVLGEQMARLARLAHRIVWVNPRSQSERFEPLVGGMAAALPYVDTFTSGHSLAALDDVLAAIAK